MINKIYYKYRLIIWVIYIMTILGACSNTKFLPKDEKLYTFTWYDVKGTSKIRQLPFKAYDMYSIGYVNTNWNYFTFSRFSLTSYNYLKPKHNRQWGVRYYFWGLLSKPPVLYSDVNIEQRREKMQQTLFDYGHFDSKISLSTKVTGKTQQKIRATYHIHMRQAYTLRNIAYYGQGNAFDRIVRQNFKKSYLVKGEDYWLKNIHTERERISFDIKNKGYFFFEPDFLVAEVDTSVGQREVDLVLKLKEGINPKKLEQYYINQVSLVVDSSKTDLQFDTLTGVWFKPQTKIKQKYINRLSSLKKGELLTLDAQNQTIDRLNALGIFQNVEISYEPDTTHSNALNAQIDLQTSKPIEAGVELNFAYKTNDYLGPSIIFSLSHANVFKGAERLSIELRGGFEWQRKRRAQAYALGYNSYEIGSKVSLDFPRFIFPLGLQPKPNRHTPHTLANVSYSEVKRVQNYRVSIGEIDWQYRWTTKKYYTISAQPLYISYFNLIETSSSFDEYLLQYPSVARSFEKQLNVGSKYSITFEHLIGNFKQNKFYNQSSVSMFGNVLNLISKASDHVSDNLNPDQFFSLPYSQFIKFSNDFRYYYSFKPRHKVATRLFMGLGIPYNHSDIIPYHEQFVAGGSSDVRAFFSRSLGPGSFQRPETNSNVILDQAGEIKLLISSEYRFPMMSFIEGAMFIDAGNVWLYHTDSSRVGGVFKWNQFMSQLAMGVGLGLRANLDFIVIRVDAALPIRYPYGNQFDQWAFTKPDFFSQYTLSFAIGYPF